MADSSPSGFCTVVTGAAGGIGRAVAERMLASGERIAAADIDGRRLEELFGRREDVLLVACDLATDAGLETLCMRIKERFKGVKGFVHAAGFDEMAPISMVSPESMRALFALHAVFPVRFLGWMSRNGNVAEDAAAVLISSLAAHEGAKGHVAYAAAKGAVEGFLRPAAAELLARGVRLNAVALGIVDTEMSREWLGKLSHGQRAELDARYPLGFGRAEDVAEAVQFLLSPSARWIAGQVLVCDGGHGLT